MAKIQRHAQSKAKGKRRDELKMSVGHTTSDLVSKGSAAKMKSKPFSVLLQELEIAEAEKQKDAKNTVITRGVLGEREITFRVEPKKRRKNPEPNSDEDETDGRERKERNNGRKQQRFKGRRSASNNVIRKLG